MSPKTTPQTYCGFKFYPLDPTNFSPYAYAAYDFKIAINVVACPFTILLNILVTSESKHRDAKRAEVIFSIDWVAWGRTGC